MYKIGKATYMQSLGDTGRNCVNKISLTFEHSFTYYHPDVIHVLPRGVRLHIYSMLLDI